MVSEDKKNIKGSPSRDEFKQKHKELLRWFYASDADLCLVSKNPPGVVAYLDFKLPNDEISFAEGILYNAWIKTGTPVFVIQGDPETGQFMIMRVLQVDWKPNPPIVQYDEEIYPTKDWDEYQEWEKKLRWQYTLNARMIRA